MSFIKNIPSHGDGDKCPACKDGHLRLAISQYKTKNGNINFWLPCDTCKYHVTAFYTKENGNSIELKKEIVKKKFGVRGQAVMF
jgi:transcriptional regulator NrdR family protein